MRRRRNFYWSKRSPSFAPPPHLQQKSQFDMPFHHRVNEGLIQCTEIMRTEQAGAGESSICVRRSSEPQITGILC